MMRWRRLSTMGVIAALLVSALGFGSVTAASAATPPVQLGKTDSGSSITVLMAGSAVLSSGLSVESPTYYPKHLWVKGFAPGRSATWQVETTTPGAYHATVLLSGSAGQRWSLVAGTDQIDFATPNGGWDRVDIGEIDVKDLDSLSLAPLSGSNSLVKSVELVPAAEWESLQARAAAFKGAASATRDAFSEKDWGLFFQYGPWSYPQTGTTKLGLEDITNRFDVDYFADWVEGLGAQYVIWSASWWTYQLQMPVKAVDDVLGNGSRTAERNLIGEIAAELKSRGLMFFVYYHTGQDEHLGYGSTDFWQAQNWPNPQFTLTGSGDRSTFFTNWKKIVGEIGTTLGDDLDGWFFDDGLLYYPADFESLSAAAREGNNQRLVSYNPWRVSSYTPFQDVNFGEDCLPLAGPAPFGGNGVHHSGPQAGLLEQCMIRTENDWGVSKPNQPAVPRYSAAALACIVEGNRQRNVPTTLGAMMWSPQPGDLTSHEKPSPQTIATFQQMTELLKVKSTLTNDTDPRLAYTGNWGYSSGRNPSAGDYCADVHYTTSVGASAKLTFDGTGAKVLGPIDGLVNADVFLDGQKVKTISETRPTYTAQQTLYEVSGLARGPHTIEIIRRGGSYLQIDAFAIENAPPADVTAPSLTATLDPAAPDGQNGWYVGAVSATAVASDAGTGVARLEHRASPSGTWTAYESPIPAPEGTTDYDFQAIDGAGNTATAHLSVKRDATAPVSSVVVSPVSGVVTAGSTVSATFTGSDAVSGVASTEYSTDGGATWVVATGEGVSFTEVGEYRVKFRSVDVAGNVEEAQEVALTVVQPRTFKGFYAPVDMAGVVNVVKSGSTVPLKFELFFGEQELTSTTAIESLRTVQHSCDPAAAVDEIETVLTGGTSLVYDTEVGQFQYNWKTPKGTTGCFDVIVRSTDGVELEAQFRLK